MGSDENATTAYYTGSGGTGGALSAYAFQDQDQGPTPAAAWMEAICVHILAAIAG
jgi:hypothetical protein